jgi:uncharacterized membrane protein
MSFEKNHDEIANTEQNPYAPPMHESVSMLRGRKYIDYDVIQQNSELRACARKQLQGIWGQMALAFFVYHLIIYIPMLIFSEISPLYNKVIDNISTVVVYIFTGPFTLGFVGYFLKRIRNEEIAVRNIFDGFKRFVPSFLVTFFIYLFVALWSLLLIIPGIIKGLGYSMAYYIMYDNPEIKPLEAIKKSQIMMKGYKAKLFCLYLSFIGWYLLGLLTLGIGYLWLYPYEGLSVTNFYENLKIVQEKSILEDTETKDR